MGFLHLLTYNNPRQVDMPLKSNNATKMSVSLKYFLKF